MAKKAYIGVEKLTTTAVDLADVDSLQEFWVGRYDPYGNVPEWNSQSGGYEFSGNSVYAQDFYREINDGRLQVESNTIYFIPDSYPQYYVKVIYINYQQSLQPDEFIAYKTGNKGVARKIIKGYIGVEQASSYTLASNGTRDFIDGSVSVTSFSTYQINSNGTLTPGDPTTTTLDELWQYVESGANDLYFYFTGESSITECYQLYDYGLGNRTEYVYSVNVYTVTGSNFVQVAHKIKKAYIGIGGIARPCWAGGELAYYGTVEGLSTARGYLAATTVGDYALFGGGMDGSGYFSSAVDAYNTSLTRSTPTVSIAARSQLAATTVGDYALFGGGDTGSEASIVDAYNTSLTRSTPTPLSTARSQLAATTVGDYALFGGGYHGGYFFSVVDAYNTSLTRSTPTTLSTTRYNLAATTVGDYALFGGGDTGGYSAAVDAYNTSLTRSTPTALSTARSQLAATTVGDYALFGGGVYTGSASSAVDTYNTSLTRSTPTALSTARYNLAATTVGNYALFGGGGYNGSASVVDAYNTSLTRSTPTALSTARSQLAATTVGDYALFGGGFSGSVSAVVDAYIYS